MHGRSCNLLVRIRRQNLLSYSEFKCLRIKSNALFLAKVGMFYNQNEPARINLTPGLHKRFVHTEGTDCNQNRGANERTESSQSWSSYSNQDEYRRSYERKRSQNNRPDGGTILAKQLNHYQRLNVENNASQEEIKSAYYSLSKVYHPDVAGGTETAVENFRLITESYDILKDPAQRSDYDRELIPTTASNKTSWPSSFGNMNPVFHSRDADLFFKMRQESLMCQEMEKNPRRFKVGSFAKDPEEEEDRRSKLNRLTRQLDYISQTSYGQNPNEDVYRMHLRDTLLRRTRDINFELYSNTDRKRSGDRDPVIGFYIFGLLFLFLPYYIVSNLSDIDLAHNMDMKLQKFVDKAREKKEHDDKHEKDLKENVK